MPRSIGLPVLLRALFALFANYPIVRGLRARGGLEIDISWMNGRATFAEVRALHSGEHRFRAPRGQRVSRVSHITGSRNANISLENQDAQITLLKVKQGDLLRFGFASS